MLWLCPLDCHLHYGGKLIKIQEVNETLKTQDVNKICKSQEASET